MNISSHRDLRLETRDLKNHSPDTVYIVTHTVVATFVLFFSFLFFFFFLFLFFTFFFFTKDYNKSPKRKGKPDVQDFPRAMAKLRKSAEKVKKTLSASKEYVEERGRREVTVYGILCTVRGVCCVRGAAY